MILVKKVFSFLAITSTVILLGCSGAVSPDFGKYKMALSNQMQDMTDVLFAGHYTEFLSKYVDPSYIKSMGGVDQALLEFDNTEQQRLYADLKIAKNITPFYDPDVNQMVYQGPLLRKPIAFVQKSGKWYMMGDWFRN
jgi:hypothetical protein